MTREEIKDVILEIIADIDEEADFASLDAPERLRQASCLMLALALHLGQSLGAEPAPLAQKWISIARQNGASG